MRPRADGRPRPLAACSCCRPPWVPLVGDGQVGFCCFSYAGYVTTSVVTDRKCIQEDDIRTLCGYYSEAFKELEEGVEKAGGGDEHL